MTDPLSVRDAVVEAAAAAVQNVIERRVREGDQVSIEVRERIAVGAFMAVIEDGTWPHARRAVLAQALRRAAGLVNRDTA